MPIEILEMEVAFWWRWRRDVEATSVAIAVALNPDAARDIRQNFAIADMNGRE